MNKARVIGTATSTVKHPSLQGWRLLIVQPLMIDGNAEGVPFLAIDPLGSRTGDSVMITSDGSWVRELMGTNTTPVRWAVLGVEDLR